MNRRPNDRGVTLIITAVALPVLIVMTSFAIDIGRQRSSRRTMQARADIVSLDLIRLADGRTEDQITGDALYAAYIQDSADRNGVPVSQLVIEWGTWNGTIFVQTVGNAVPDAVQVVASETTDYFFQRGSGNVSRTAVAAPDHIASLTLGSTLAQAKLGNAALLNDVITGLLCSTPNAPPAPPPPASACPRKATVSAAGYQGLATHTVDLDDLREAGGFGSVDEMMNEDFTAEEWARLSGQAFRNNGEPSTAEAYDGDNNSLAGPVEDPGGPPRTFKPNDVIGVASPADGASAQADVNPFDIFMAGLQVSNGDNFAKMPISVPPTSLPVGISNLTLTSQFKVLEAPRSGAGRVGIEVHTAQLQLAYTLSFDVALTAGGTGVTGSVSIPVDVRGGGADATLTKIACTQPASTATIDVVTAPRVLVGTVGKSFSPTSPVTVGTLNLTVLGLPAGSVGISVYGAIGGGSQNTGAFNLAGIAIGETKEAPGSSFALGGSITSVKLQTALPVDPMNDALDRSFDDLLSALDTNSQPVLGVLGASVSTADVHNIGVDCLAPRLAG